MADRALAELPAWEPGTAAVLCTTGAAGAPHAIPVSTALRAGPRTILLALAPRRASLANLRARPAVALCVLGAGVAFTAEGTARVAAEDVAGITAVRLEVANVDDHRQPAFAIDAPVAWRWTDEPAAQRDAEVRRALQALTG
jgi:flavin reductase (DIM6/NTAB) family NADH-FMN oxidoreductase RutF